MFSRCFSVVVLVCLLALPATAQTVRFDTNVGTFDLELNPTGNANLQGHVDNILDYVNTGRYDLTVINRLNEVSPGGDADFVLQMGSLQAPGLQLPAAFTDFPSIPTFPGVITDQDNDGSIDFDTTGLTNSRGTVSLALSGLGPNSGTSSFFINLNDIPSLDPGGTIGEFVPFAQLTDFATIDLIQSLATASLPGGGVGSSNIPVLDDNFLIIIERAFVLDTANSLGPIAPAVNSFSAEFTSEGIVAASNTPVALNANVVPEPPALVLAVGALMLIAAMKRSKAM